jgi:ATP-dependent Clp protease ATP-binding subunit ClpB
MEESVSRRREKIAEGEAGGSRWLDTSEPEEMRRIRVMLEERVIGQGESIRQIVRALTRYKAGLAGQERPVAAFLLLGPTGVGKTHTVEAVADLLQGSPEAVLKVHCAEVRSDHELARMKGAPPGYVGWKECVPLFHESRLREVRRRDELAVVLFDEVEKAHPALWDLLLGLLDKGEVVLNDNTRTDFRRSIVFMTGNTGAREIWRQLGGGFGFQPQTCGDVTGLASRAASQVFTPEFQNRLTATITYKPLGWPDVLCIAKLECARLTERLRACDPHGLALHVTDCAVEAVARQGYDPRFGARHVKRVMERLIEDPLANLVAAGRLAPEDRLMVCAAGASGPVRFQRRS